MSTKKIKKNVNKSYEKTKSNDALVLIDVTSVFVALRPKSTGSYWRRES